MAAIDNHGSGYLGMARHACVKAENCSNHNFLYKPLHSKTAKELESTLLILFVHVFCRSISNPTLRYESTVLPYFVLTD